MGYNIETNALLQIQFEARLAGQQVMTIMTYRYNGSGVADGPTVIGAVEAIVKAAGGLHDKWRDCMSTDVGSMTRSYQWIYPTRYSYRLFFDDPIRTGTIADSALPPNDTQAVTRRSDFAGRDQVSTLKLPGVPSSAAFDGFLSDGQLGNLNNFAAKSVEVITLAAGAKLTPCCFQRAAPNLGAELTLYYAHNTARVMRRRTVGLGK